MIQTLGLYVKTDKSYQFVIQNASGVYESYLFQLLGLLSIFGEDHLRCFDESLKIDVYVHTCVYA